QGQLNFSFIFKLVDGTTGRFVRNLTPLTDANPQLTHDTSQTIKRSVNLAFGVDDTAAIDTIKHRVLIYMQLADGTQYSLGRFMFTDNTLLRTTGGRQASMALMDESFILDQPSQTSFPPFGLMTRYNASAQSTSVAPVSVAELVRLLLAQLNI